MMISLDKFVDWFRRSLKQRASVTAYLLSRGISDSVLAEFKIGYCDKDSGFPDKRFINRIIFPIFDHYGRTVALAGRAPKGMEKKFLNTRYTKTNHLYGLNFARKEIIKLNQALVVEGYFDVLTLHSLGIKNVVAVQGSYLHKEQAFLLNRLCDNIIYIGDGDASVLDLKKFGFFDSVRSVVMPVGYDPDSYILKYGKDRFFQYINNFEIERIRRKIKEA